MKILKFLIVLVIVLTAYGYYSIVTTTVQKQDFTVRAGDTVATLRDRLGIDLSPVLYRIATKLYFSNNVLQSGTYRMQESVSLRIFFSKTLTKPESKDVEITILPGWNVFDIDEQLSARGIVWKGEIIAVSDSIPETLRSQYPFLVGVTNLEGFLLPDTYRIKPSAAAQDVIRKLLDEFNTRIYTAYTFSSSREFYDTLILASIVEKEEKSETNKPIVAGILKKRITTGDIIGADATVCYAYRLSMEGCTPEFINGFIYKKTAYNTRMKTGLPPTPIANPSADTFAATVNAESTPYYYYLHDSQGNIRYGRTLEEHNANRVRYLGK